MEIGNRKHKDIVQRSRGKVMVTVKADKMYFTKAAVEECNLKVGKFVHFLSNGKDWSFIQNDDADGFSIVSDGGQKMGFVVNSRGLVAMFAKQTGHSKFPCSFYIRKTGKTHDGHTIMEINTHKPVGQIGN